MSRLEDIFLRRQAVVLIENISISPCGELVGIAGKPITGVFAGPAGTSYRHARIVLYWLHR